MALIQYKTFLAKFTKPFHQGQILLVLYSTYMVSKDVLYIAQVVKVARTGPKHSFMFRERFFFGVNFFLEKRL